MTLFFAPPHFLLDRLRLLPLKRNLKIYISGNYITRRLLSPLKMPDDGGKTASKHDKRQCTTGNWAWKTIISLMCSQLSICSLDFFRAATNFECAFPSGLSTRLTSKFGGVSIWANQMLRGQQQCAESFPGLCVVYFLLTDCERSTHTNVIDKRKSKKGKYVHARIIASRSSLFANSYNW